MFFVSSGNIVADYPELEQFIVRLDGHLAAVGEQGIRADTASDFVGADPAEIERLLKEYLRRKVLRSEQGYLCPQCVQLLGLIRDGRELWCDVCERTQSLRGKALRGCVLYRVRADAERVPLQPAAMTSVSAGTAVISILFVAGDRGGGPRAQLDLPGEEKALRQAVKNATLAARFAFLPPLYAATAGHLVEQVEAGPGILHFVGHGAERRLHLVDQAQALGVQPVIPERLVELLRHAPVTIRLAYFNTCDSDGIARVLTEKGVVEAAIGWPGKINDTHAVQYAETFYRLACSGRPLEQAMQMAAICLGTSPIQPQLCVASGIDPNGYALIRSAQLPSTRTRRGL